MNEHRILVVIPAYNVKKYIAQTINEVINQGYRNVRIVCVDDCSTDGTREILQEEEAKRRIELVLNPVNQGLTKTFNTCLRQRRDEKYIYIAHADDLMMGANLEKKVMLMEEHDRIGMVCSDALFINGRNEVIEGPTLNSLRESHVYKSGDDAFSSVFKGDNWIVAPSVIMRSEVIDQLGDFDTRLSLATDLNMWLRIAARWNIAYIGEPLIKYRVHPGQDSKKYRPVAAQNEEYMAKRLALQVSRGYLRDAWRYYTCLRRTYSTRGLMICEHNCATGNYNEAWMAWMFSMRVGWASPAILLPAGRLLGKIILHRGQNQD
ncbi:MAG: glycosyltransferase [Kiritimatiellae bacterium]|nr:glycosyltransferase [Kiritimatiellia bacterium]